MKIKHKLLVIGQAALLAVAYIVLITLAAFVLAAKPAQAGELSFQIHGASYHLDRDGKDFNETNEGMGLLYKDNRDRTYSAGFYHNSNYNRSYYASVGVMKQVNKYVSGGVEVGVVTGYARAEFAPYLVPVAGIGPVRIRFIPYPTPVFGMSLEIPFATW